MSEKETSYGSTEDRRPPDGRVWAETIGAIAVIVVLVLSGMSIVLPQAEAAAPGWGPANVPIQHIIMVDMENHAFDNYFGTYCQAHTSACPNTTGSYTIPANTCVPYYPNNNTAFGCIKPFNQTSLTVGDLGHMWTNTHQSVNGGAMNNFYVGEGGKTTEPYGHWNGTTIPGYWDLAQEYALGENFYSSAETWSLSNHWYQFAGQAPPISFNMSQGRDTPLVKHTYLNEANATETVQDLLNNSPGVSWTFYDNALPSYATAINDPAGSGAYNPWNPFLARSETYDSYFSTHFKDRSKFFANAQKGTLPNVTWIIPQSNDSDHPPANLSQGQQYVLSIVDAVEASPEWKSSAIFLTWDDYGGFYDQMTPPTLDNYGASVRVPLIVISPYTYAGRLVSHEGYFESILHFIEWKFNLGCITTRDCTAPSMFKYFNFNMTARAPIIFPQFYSQMKYPFAGTGMTKAEFYGTQIDPNAWNPLPGQPDTDDD